MGKAALCTCEGANVRGFPGRTVTQSARCDESLKSTATFGAPALIVDRATILLNNFVFTLGFPEAAVHNRLLGVKNEY